MGRAFVQTRPEMIVLLLVLCLTQLALADEDPNSVPRLGKRMDAPISWQLGKRAAAWNGPVNLQQVPAAKPWPQRKRSSPFDSYGQAATLGFRYVQVPGQFYKREYLVPSPDSGFEKRARDLTSSLNRVPMMGKRGSDGFPPYNIDIRYEE